MTITYKQAIQQATQLRKQGLTWPAIAAHLAKIGYVSPFTKQPVGHLAVRHMVVSPQKETEMPTSVDVGPQTTIVVSSPKAEALEAIAKILAVKDLSVQQKYELMEYLMRRTIQTSIQAAEVPKQRRKRRTKEQMMTARREEVLNVKQA